MTTSEWSALMQGFGGSGVEGDVDGLLRALLETSAGALDIDKSRSVSSDIAAIISPANIQGRAGNGAASGNGFIGAAQIEQVVNFPAPLPMPPPVSSTSAQPTSEGRSATSAVMQTMGMITGVGPVVTGLLKLFGGGGGSSDQPVYSPVPYSLPEQVSVEAGLAHDRSFVGVGYAAQGGVRGLSTATKASATPQIQINVQAMDSRSFADHSDEIARAVREAMLRSHNLNDVISEL
jgi:hypothetical protein